MAIIDYPIRMALNSLVEKSVNPMLKGIGVVKDIKYSSGEKKLFLNIELAGLEDKPIVVEATDISIAPDGDSITIKTFSSPMPFVHNALNQFGTMPIPIPEGFARTALKTVKRMLKL